MAESEKELQNNLRQGNKHEPRKGTGSKHQEDRMHGSNETNRKIVRKGDTN